MRGGRSNVCRLRTHGRFPSSRNRYRTRCIGLFRGDTAGYLIIAEGCNFPEVPIAEGGTKRYYKGIYATPLDKGIRLTWRQIGALPDAAAYGVSIITGDGLIFIGGNNQRNTFSSVIRIRWESHSRERIQIDSLPGLPFPSDNMTGCRAGDYLYVAGGNKAGIPCHQFIRLDLRHEELRWETLPPFPGQARIQLVCGAIGTNFFLFGGFDLTARSIALNDYLYRAEAKAWEEITGPVDEYSSPLALGGGASVSMNDRMFFVGGIHRNLFRIGMTDPPADYMKHPTAWYRFNPYLLQYDVNGWSILEKSPAKRTGAGELPVTARTGTSFVNDGKNLYLIGGELKPGIRTNEIYRITVK